ncbi:MAG TPA: VCBS repeat-containing protein, partial [Desulfobacteria bacterium]|nr:VCBS repeat-containing protein [Desulfobacteria bacterium]
QLWKSDDFFGGSLIDMEYMDPDANRMANTAKKLFIASPIFTCDVNGDGKREVIICKNNSESGRIFEHFRWFGSGRVHFMDWDEAGLVSNWTSQKLSGTVVGYRVADVDNDGMKELVVGSVTGGSVAGSPKARLVVYDLE